MRRFAQSFHFGGRNTWRAYGQRISCADGLLLRRVTAILPSTSGEGLELFAFDEAYVDRLREGDPSTESHFIAYFSKLIQIKLRARFLAPEIVDDLKQETFTRVIRSLRADGSIRQADRLRPLESAVILSPDRDSYKLYARDVVQHPLKAYLVTISACNGAGTKTYAGEGLVGLSWAFLRAGAQNVIAGLWEVSNASTPQLMDELYRGIHNGEDPATALRKAKLTLMHSTGNYRKPFYWAPFLIYAAS